MDTINPAASQPGTYAMVDNFIRLLGECPIVGTGPNDEKLRKVWSLGVVEGAAAAMTVAVNQMGSPAHTPYTENFILHELLIPLTQSHDRDWAISRIEQLVMASWGDTPAA